MSTPKSVDPKDPSKRSSKLMAETDATSTVVLDRAANVCYWNDEEFEEGASISLEGTVYECSYGNWVKSR